MLEAISINQDTMRDVIQAAFDKTTDRRWHNAIVRAKQIIESYPLATLLDNGTLVVLSESNEVYEVTNHHCVQTSGRSCPANAKGFPCKHRALRQLMLRYKQRTH